MTLRGYIKNGKVVLDEPAPLPEGTEVDVVPARTQRKPAAKMSRARKRASGSGGAAKPKRRSAAREPVSNRLATFIGIAKGLPADFAAQHDHYIHGTKKR